MDILQPRGETIMSYSFVSNRTEQRVQSDACINYAEPTTNRVQSDACIDYAEVRRKKTKSTEKAARAISSQCLDIAESRLRKTQLIVTDENNRLTEKQQRWNGEAREKERITEPPHFPKTIALIGLHSINKMNTKYNILASLLLLCACNGSQEKPKDLNQDPQMFEEPSYTPQYPSTYTPQQSNDVQEQIEHAKVEPIASVKISKEYQEGYDAGYDDGEDDALSRNGYEGQYDDGCRYKSQKRKDYQLGYAEGYEAGFYDNASDNGDDEEYE